jgi:hypothetical protein
MVGDYLLIAPIYRDELVNQVKLPEGRWRYWFDNSVIIQGPVEFEETYPLDEYPVYIREGAIIPMDIKRSYTAIGNEEDEGFLTFLVYPDLEINSFEVFREDDVSTTLSYHLDENALDLEIAGKECPHILHIALTDKPAAVLLDGADLTEELDYTYNQQEQKLSIRTRDYAKGQYHISF